MKNIGIIARQDATCSKVLSKRWLNKLGFNEIPTKNSGYAIDAHDGHI